MEPSWSPDRYFPRFPTTDKVYVFKVPNAMVDWWGAPASSEWRISDSPETMDALTLVGMQGVINRQRSCIYLDWEEADLYKDTDGFWLPLMREHVQVVELPYRGVNAVKYLLQNYGDMFNGAVVYDPEIPDTINVATMIAGIEDRVMVSPQQLAEPGFPTFASVVDLTTIARDNGWEASGEGRLAVYQWVYDNLWTSLEKRIIGVVCPGPPSSGEIVEGSSSLFPLSLTTRDYVVALRLPALWLSPVDAPQRALFARFLADAPHPIPVFGFVDRYEEPTVDLASEYGDWVAVLTNGNAPTSSGSLSCLSGLPVEAKPYQPEIDLDDIFATLGDDPIVTFLSSDGDALQYVIDRGFYSHFTWDQMQGSSIGFTINPVLIDLAPLIWNYYVDSADDTALMCGYSGAGYTYPNLMNDEMLVQYLERTATYLKESGLRTVWFDSRRGAYDTPMASMYSEYLSDTEYLGSYIGATSLGYLSGGSAYVDAHEPSQPCTYTFSEGSGAWLRRKIFEITPGRINLEMGEYPWHSGVVETDSEALTGKTIRFSATSGTGVKVWGPWAALEPGEYSTTYRMKVSGNTANAAVAEVFVEERYAFSDWRTIASRTVKANSFTSAGTYQDFTLTFSLDRQTPLVEFELSYLGSVDLSLESIRVSKLSEVHFPVFSCVLITPCSLPEVHSTIESIKDDGGHVLTPDEFLGALNPEFMIDWASNILGEDHPSIAAASQQFLEGEYYQSLLTIRSSLRELPTHTYSIPFEESNSLYTATIVANTLITDENYVSDTNLLEFLTHGPPYGTARLDLRLSEHESIGRVYVDDVLKMEASSPETSEYGLEFSQGPHKVGVEVYFMKPPTASFTCYPIEVAIGEEVTFTDRSTSCNPTRLEWDFGDGSSSTAKNPRHSYSAPGTYLVELSAVDEMGVKGTSTRQVTVLRPPEFYLSEIRVSPETITEDTPVVVTVLCRNTGGTPGTHEIMVELDGASAQTKSVTLGPGEEEDVTFNLGTPDPGVHRLKVDYLTTEFTVKGKIPGFTLISLALGIALALLSIKRGNPLAK